MDLYFLFPFSTLISQVPPTAVPFSIFLTDAGIVSFFISHSYLFLSFFVFSILPVFCIPFFRTMYAFEPCCNGDISPSLSAHISENILLYRTPFPIKQKGCKEKLLCNRTIIGYVFPRRLPALRPCVFTCLPLYIV